MDSVENGSKCKDCKGRMFTMALQEFNCKKCKKQKTASHGGGWQYCDSCAKELSVCPMCGKKLP